MIGKNFYRTVFQQNNTILTAMKYSFFLKTDYKNKDGKFPLYLNLYIHSQRKRVPVDIFLFEKDWDKNSQTIKTPALRDLNLILNEIKSQINNIEIQFRLTNQILTVEKCVELLRNPEVTEDFIAFMDYEMKYKKLEPSTKKNHLSALTKLKKYRKSILFTEITDVFINKYRHYLFYSLKNQEVTIDSNIKIIKSYIKIAKKRGYQINVDLEDIKIRQHRSHRTNLTLEEIENLKEYYTGIHTKPSHRKTLGYFLFNCMTGLRIADLLALKREDLNDEYFNFWNRKSKKQQLFKTNQTCKDILKFDQLLFINPPTEKMLNENLKEICRVRGIRKSVSCHVARHTFATNYLRRGGKVEDLQVLLGHSDISTTMIYVHIVESDIVNSVSLLD